MNHFSQQLNMSHISQCKPLVRLAFGGGLIAQRWDDQDGAAFGLPLPVSDFPVSDFHYLYLGFPKGNVPTSVETLI